MKLYFVTLFPQDVRHIEEKSAALPISDVQETQKTDKLIEEIVSNHVVDELMISIFYC